MGFAAAAARVSAKATARRSVAALRRSVAVLSSVYSPGAAYDGPRGVPPPATPAHPSELGAASAPEVVPPMASPPLAQERPFTEIVARATVLPSVGESGAAAADDETPLAALSPAWTAAPAALAAAATLSRMRRASRAPVSVVGRRSIVPALLSAQPRPIAGALPRLEEEPAVPVAAPAAVQSTPPSLDELFGVAVSSAPESVEAVVAVDRPGASSTVAASASPAPSRPAALSSRAKLLQKGKAVVRKPSVHS